MGLRFRKSVKIAPGVRINFGKKSTSVSVGTKGFRKTYSSSGRTTTTVSAPGTGFSYSVSSKSGTNNRKKSLGSGKAAAPKTKSYSSTTYKICGTILLVLSVPLIVLSLIMALVVSPIIGVITVFSVVLFKIGRSYRKRADIAGDNCPEDSPCETDTEPT